jgi:cobalt-zinc-cadmium efflux system protein
VLGIAINIHLEHVEPPNRQQRFGRHLLIAMAASLAILVIELWGAAITGSLGLLADAGHAVTDMSGLILAYLALRWASRPATPQATYGYYRAEVLAALINGILLIGIVGFLVFRAFDRLRSPLLQLDSLTVQLVAGAAMVVNIGAAVLLRGDAQKNINAKGAFFNVVGDALASFAVLVSGLLVFVTGHTIWDTLVTFVVAGIILVGAIHLLRQTTSILLEVAPPHIDLAEMKQAVEKVDGVINVHDLHVWTLTPGRHSASLHVSIAKERVPTFHAVIRGIEDLLADEFGLEHCTIQVEPEGEDHVSNTTTR